MDFLSSIMSVKCYFSVRNKNRYLSIQYFVYYFHDYLKKTNEVKLKSLLSRIVDLHI